MKITFVIPGVGKKDNEPYVNSWKMEPLTIAVLAGLTPDDVEIEFFDDRLEVIPYDRPTDLAAINVETYTAKRAYQIASLFRQRGVPVIMGGYHPTLMRNEVIEYADAVLIGEAEGVWSTIVEDAKQKKLKKFYQSDRRPAMNDIKPRREIFKDKKYLPLTLVETARGCRFSCNFCSIFHFFKSTYNCRPTSDIIAEIERLGKSRIFLVDDNISVDLKRAKELFKALIPLKIQWISQASLDISEDDELLMLMKKSGCLGLLIGFESLNKNNLSQMQKSWNAPDIRFNSVLQKIREVGIAVYGTFIFGYDCDDKDSFKKTLEFTLKQKLFLAAFNHLVPFPGTSLYDTFEKEGRLLYKKWWLDSAYNFGDVAFRPKLLSPEQLSLECLKARRTFYRFSSIMKRGNEFRSNCRNLPMLFNYYLFNMTFRREVEKRQGLPIGSGLDEGLR